VRNLFLVALLVSLSACATPGTTFVPSKKSAVELRSMETRLVDRTQDATMRDVIATVQDLGYRITKVEPDAGTISATRATTLRMAVVVRPNAPQASIVRANASLVALGREAQVDSPEFYERDFFSPLSAEMQRALAPLPDSMVAPDAIRPIAELNTVAERKAAKSAQRAVPTPPRTREPDPR
jgi:hypothetical protein